MRNMVLAFSPDELNSIEKIKSRYPEPQAALMPVLWLAQHKFGWISDDVKRLVADTLKLSYAHVHGVAGFYTMYHKRQPGKYHIQVCTNVSCMLLDGDKNYEHVCKKLNLKHNEVTPDGKFSLEEVECMGACGEAPMLAINEDFYKNVNTKQIDELIELLK